MPHINYKFFQNQADVTIEIYQKGLKMDDVKAEFVQPDLIKVTLLDKEHMFDLSGTGEDLRIHTNAFKVELTFRSTRIPNFFDFLLKAEVTAANEEKQKKYTELDKPGLLDKANDSFDSVRDVHKLTNI